MTACPIRYQRQVPDRKGKIFYTSITSLSHISKSLEIIKCIIGTVMVKKGIWINNIVADKKGEV